MIHREYRIRQTNIHEFVPEYRAGPRKWLLWNRRWEPFESGSYTNHPITFTTLEAAKAYCAEVHGMWRPAQDARDEAERIKKANQRIFKWP